MIETLEDISKAYVLRWHIEETTQSRSREFFWRGCITRILGKLGHVQYIIASYDDVVNRMCASIREFGFRIPIVAKSDGTVVDGI